MSGGTFVPGVKKVRPGTYFNFEDDSKQKMSLSERGAVIIPLYGHSWGPEGEFVKVLAGTSDAQFSKLGYHISDREVVLVRESLKRALVAYVYRIGTGEKAKVEISKGLEAVAKYSGTRGNDLKVSSVTNISGGMDITIFLGTEKVEFFENVEDIKSISSKWINFVGDGALEKTPFASKILTGGTNKECSNADILSFIEQFEVQDGDAVCFPFEDASAVQIFDGKIKYLRDQVGKKLVGVRPATDVAPDYEGIIAVNSEVTLADYQLTKAESCAWVAGASAGSQVNQSLTHQQYEGAIGIKDNKLDDEIKLCLKRGEFVFTTKVENGATKVIVEQDINSLTTYTKIKKNAYSKNRVIRTLDEIVKLGVVMLPPNKYDGNDDGYALIGQELVDILLKLQKVSALKNVNKEEDVIIDIEETKGDEYHAAVRCQPVDSVEKLYITVRTS